MSLDETRLPEENNEPEAVTPQEGQFVEVEPIAAAPVEPVANVPDSTPYDGEPMTSGSAPSFDVPVSDDPPKKDNKKIWIIVAIVAVVLCCCCILVVALSLSWETIEDEFLNLFHTLPTFASAYLAA